MKTVTVYDSWRSGRFERYYLTQSGEKVILEQAENMEPPFVKLQLVSTGSREGGTVGSVEE